jgi:uncharacterized protein (TIGR00645 family)
MHDCHQRTGHAGGVLVLDDVASVNDASGALLDECLGAGEDLCIGGLAAAADEDRDPSGGLDDLVINGHVVRRICLDDIRAQLTRLADEWDDLHRVAVHHVSAGLGVRLKDQWLDHERDAVAVALGFELQDVLDALIGDLGLAGDAEEIYHDARCIEADRLFHGVFDHPAKKRTRQLLAVNVGDIRAEHECGFRADGKRLEIVRLSDRELDGIGRRMHERLHCFAEILDALQKSGFIEKAVVDGNVEAAPGGGIEESIETIFFHAEARRVGERMRAPQGQTRLPNQPGMRIDKRDMEPAPQSKRTISSLIFLSRWLQAPLYFGLILAQGVYVFRFMKELYHLLADAQKLTENEIIIVVLGLIDIVMIANLLIMVIVGGYETFVSRLNLQGHPDQPEWLSHVNAGILKVKLATALIGISSIHLLKTFVTTAETKPLPDGGAMSEKAMMWQVIIHATFVLSAWMLAVIDRMTYRPPAAKH